jgi:serine/threonine protein kinase
MADLIGEHLGQYEITGLLGEGGMATVYRARQVSMKRDVAIKVIESKLTRNPDFVKRFEREAQTVASLSHPFILKVFDYGQQGESIYLVMELLVGGSLADHIRRGPLSLDTTTRLLEQIASALDYAHERGVVHRDLKPQNVLLDEKSNALLTDFGIAKLLGETTGLTRSGVAMGTPSYMAPEQWKGQPIDARADIYALGVMLFEMLSGRLPFIADTPYSMMHMHVNEPPPSLHTLRQDLPPGIERVIERALAKDRDQRFASAMDMVSAFKDAQVYIPSYDFGAVAPSHSDQKTLQEPLPSQLAVRRHRKVTIGISALVGIILLVGLVLVIASGAATQIPPTPAFTSMPSAPQAPTTTPRACAGRSLRFHIGQTVTLTVALQGHDNLPFIPAGTQGTVVSIECSSEDGAIDYAASFANDKGAIQWGWVVDPYGVQQFK